MLHLSLGAELALAQIKKWYWVKLIIHLYQWITESFCFSSFARLEICVSVCISMVLSIKVDMPSRREMIGDAEIWDIEMILDQTCLLVYNTKGYVCMWLAQIAFITLF